MRPLQRPLNLFLLILSVLLLWGLWSHPRPSRAEFIGTDVRYVFADDLKSSGFGNVGFSDAGQVDLSYGNTVGPLQAEYEFWLRQQNLDTFVDNSGSRFSASGRMYTAGLRVNLFERFTFWDWTGPWVPFWGFGLGVQVDSVSDAELGPTKRLDGLDVGFGFNWLMGVDYPLTETLNLGVDTQLFWAQGPSFTETSQEQDINFGGRFDASLGLRFHWRF